MLTPDDIAALVQGRHGDPLAVLGPHVAADGITWVRVFLPGAVAVQVVALPLASVTRSSVKQTGRS